MNFYYQCVLERRFQDGRKSAVGNLVQGFQENQLLQFKGDERVQGIHSTESQISIISMILCFWMREREDNKSYKIFLIFIREENKGYDQILMHKLYQY